MEANQNQEQPTQEIAKPNTAIAEGQVITEQKVIVEGKTTFFNLKGKTPVWVKNAVNAIQKTLAALATLVAASELYPPYTSKRIIFVLLASAIIVEGIGRLFGVETPKDNK